MHVVRTAKSAAVAAPPTTSARVKRKNRTCQGSRGSATYSEPAKIPMVAGERVECPIVPSHHRHTLDCDLLPQFTAVYLRVAGDECAFIETHTAHAQPKLLAALAERHLRPEQVRWIVVTHAHLDHAAGAGALMAACPNATLVAHPRAARHLIEPEKLIAGATAVYGEARFAELYGTIAPIPKQRVLALDDGATFSLGDATLRVHHTAGHANHHFVVADP